MESVSSFSSGSSFFVSNLGHSLAVEADFKLHIGILLVPMSMSKLPPPFNVNSLIRLGMDSTPF